MNFDRTRFIGKFTQEARELLRTITNGLIQLERTPSDLALLKEILRATHTLKGASKIVRFNTINLLSHKVEDLLIAVQDGKCPLTEDIIELLFLSTDTLGRCVENILNGEEENLDVTELCSVLDETAGGASPSEYLAQHALQLRNAWPAASKDAGDPVPPVQARQNVDERNAGQAASKDAGDPVPPIPESIKVGIDRLDNTIRLVGGLAVGWKKSEHSVTLLKDVQRMARRHAKRLHYLLQETDGNISQEMKTDMTEESLRMLRLLEQVFHESRDELAARKLDLNELYDDVLTMRMLPLSVIFEWFPRAVRDMAKTFHKEIELHIHGEETRLDKKIIEQLESPLMHILRNCIDHGIETPDERKAQNKPEPGSIMIDASQKSGHITISVSDDGRGIQRKKLKERAITRGLISEENARTLSDDDILQLIFLPRLSTSDLMTEISGRGVGMDIVKTNIEHLKGSISVHSMAGRGTIFSMTLPMTLTTLRCLIISAHNKFFAVPITSVEETLHISPHECIDVVGHPAIRLRNHIIYIVNLAETLGLGAATSQRHEKECVLIARTNGKRVGFMVDDIVDEHDVVVKQLPPHLQYAKSISGATISSDNTIILILHIPEIIEIVKRSTGIALHDELQEPEQSRSPHILVVEDSVNTGEIEQQILEASGYTVDLAHDGVDALECAGETQYDLIVTDIEMPRMDGFTLTEHLRERPEYADVPIVIVTSLEREQDKRRGLRVGANAYITKGDFEQRSLLDTIKSLI